MPTTPTTTQPTGAAAPTAHADSDSHASVPIWTANGAPAPEPSRALAGDVRTDVAVVGAGIVGLMTARLCRAAGLDVVVLEAKRVGAGESLRSTAHVTAQIDARWNKLVEDLGEATARTIWREAAQSIDVLESAVASLGVDCGWRRVPAFLFTESDRGLYALRDEERAAQSIGIPCAMLEGGIELPWNVAGALRIENQARIDPAALLAALADDLARQGVPIFEHTAALEVRDDAEPTVVTNTGVVSAKHVVVAAHAPFNNRLLLQTKIAHYRSYVLALRSPRSLPEGLFWDDADPYHYLRTMDHRGEELVLVGGEDHRTGQDDDTSARIGALASWALERLPGSEVVGRWSGQILEPVDGLPYVGRNSLERNVLEATGLSGTGWAYGVLAARMLTDAIQGRTHPLADTLAATRVTPMASARRFIQENVQFPWHFFGDRLSTEATEIDSLLPGTGKLFMSRGMRKIAVYRDVQGVLHALSPVCPHMGCIIEFNGLESSWDCPCHGSRFDVEGRLLNGPATAGLERLELLDPHEAARGARPRS
jgi:glycine/D-amino acid oxidase-like deaminating enzyme/nitrite reductase/ring-hydroxylating ferredoxin subunit